MATQAIAGTSDKVLSAALPGLLKGVGLMAYNGHALWSKIDRGGRKKEWEGDSIQAAVMTSKYNKAASYQNDDTVDTTSVEPFQAVQFEMGGYQVSINLPGMKIRKVQSQPNRLFELLKTETTAAVVDMIDVMSGHLLQATNYAKGILSLYTITDTSTTIAGLAGSSSWGGTTVTSGSFAAQGLNDLMTLHTTLSVYMPTLDDAGNNSGMQQEPDIHVTDRASWQRYWNRLESSMRYVPGGEGDVKLKLAFMGTPVMVDTHATSGSWFALHSPSMYMYVHPDADFEVLPSQRTTTQPDTWSRAAIWNGQIVFNSRRHFGKCISISD